MSVGFGRISKGLFQKSIEQVANDEWQRPRFLNTLCGTPPAGEVGDWVDFLRNHGGLDRASENYVRNEWMRFWQPEYPEYSPDVVQEMLRQSLVKSIQLADSLPTDDKRLMPIDCHWIWTENNDKFEVLIASSGKQVTRILLTPPPPTDIVLPLRFLAPYFIVKLGPIDSTREQEDPESSEVRAYTGTPLVVTAQLKSVR